MIANKITATYKQVGDKMVHDGYFIYGDGVTLKWVDKNNVKEVY